VHFPVVAVTAITTNRLREAEAARLARSAVGEQPQPPRRSRPRRRAVSRLLAFTSLR
jgi:hypothetical protein